MSNLVTIFGGSGFVGRYIARRMAKQGWRVRVAVRRPNEAHFVRTYGVVGQVEPILANIRYDESVAQAVAGADAVVNCVGTFDRGGKNNFGAVQDEGAARIARLASEAGISRMVHISAIGADTGGASLYAQSKGRGEEGGVGAYAPTRFNPARLPPVVFAPPRTKFLQLRLAAMSPGDVSFPATRPAPARKNSKPVYLSTMSRLRPKRACSARRRPASTSSAGRMLRSFRELMLEMLRR